jgi:RND family efflux transporter MFP subunit
MKEVRLLPANEALTKRLRQFAIVGVCVAVLILLAGFIERYVQASEVKTWTRDEDVPTVALVSPSAMGQGQALELPGTLQALYDAKIYSRVPGYLRAWYTDIGARVHKGDVLAVIDTPELDQQIDQAQADLGAAVAAQRLAGTLADRFKSLLPIDAVSRQDVEVKAEDYSAKSGAAKAAEANLTRLKAMKEFARIVAPFDGVVTNRSAEIGALVNPGSGSSDAPLFSVADVARIRVYVRVPQSYSAQIVPNMAATLTLPEYPAKTFAARLVSTSDAISAQSSTLLVELEADNPDGLLKPGDYADVRFALPRNVAALRVPVSALIFRAAGLEVATLGAHDRIVMKPIKVDTDLGTQVIVSSGLSTKDRIIDNPPDSLTTGDKVRVAGGDDAR